MWRGFSRATCFASAVLHREAIDHLTVYLEEPKALLTPPNPNTTNWNQEGMSQGGLLRRRRMWQHSLGHTGECGKICVRKFLPLFFRFSPLLALPCLPSHCFSFQGVEEVEVSIPLLALLLGDQWRWLLIAVLPSPFDSCGAGQGAK